MSVCPSGSLGILSAPQGGCSSLAGVACGTSSGPQSLLALGAAVGKAGAINMTTCWYGYNNNPQITPASFTSVPTAGCTAVVTICAPAFNTGLASCGANTWLHPQSSPYSTSPTGVAQNIVIDVNTGAARTGCVSYSPNWGGVCYISIQQLAGIVWHCVDMCVYYDESYPSFWRKCATIVTTPAMLPGECFNICMFLEAQTDQYEGPSSYGVSTISDPYTSILSTCDASYQTTSASFLISYGQTVYVEVAANTESNIYAFGAIQIGTINSVSGCYCNGNNCTYMSAYAPIN